MKAQLHSNKAWVLIILLFSSCFTLSAINTAKRDTIYQHLALDVFRLTIDSVIIIPKESTTFDHSWEVTSVNNWLNSLTLSVRKASIEDFDSMLIYVKEPQDSCTICELPIETKSIIGENETLVWQRNGEFIREKVQFHYNYILFYSRSQNKVISFSFLDDEKQDSVDRKKWVLDLVKTIKVIGK
jgi:hypothetical protein